MKNHSQIIAQYLYNLSQKSTGSQLKSRIASLVRYLAKRGWLKDKQFIIKNYLKIYYQQQGLMPVQVQSVEPVTKSQQQQINQMVKQQFGVRAEINNIIKPDLIGGIILQIGDNKIDGSVAGQLQNLKNHLSS